MARRMIMWTHMKSFRPSYFPEKIADITCLSANSTELLAMIDEGNS